MAVGDGFTQDLLQFGAGQLQGLGRLLRCVAGRDHAGAGHVDDAFFVQIFQRFQVVPVQGAERSIDADGKAFRQGVADAGRRVGELRSADELIVHLGIAGIEGDLDAVQLRFVQFPAVFRRQLDAVRIQTGDEPARVVDEFEQVFAHGRFAAREGHLRDACRTALPEDLFPFFGG